MPFILAIGIGPAFFCRANGTAFRMVNPFFGRGPRRTVMRRSMLRNVVSSTALPSCALAWQGTA